jgi:hypothetical protein
MVSQEKFTPITSRLLARKGDAVPSAVAAKPSSLWKRAAAAPTPGHFAAAGTTQSALPPGPLQIAKPHKMTVLLTASEYEKLGIAAVKKGVTRHQLVRTALDLHLERLRQEYAGCACMTAGDSCNGDCGMA